MLVLVLEFFLVLDSSLELVVELHWCWCLSCFWCLSRTSSEMVLVLVLLLDLVIMIVA